MNKQIITRDYEGTEVKFELINGESYVSIEDVARFCGWTQVKNGKEYVKWDRVNEFLSDLNSPQVGKDDFIPEYIMYPLIGKAKNEKATKFMLWVGKTIAEIRQTGKYDTIEQQIMLIEDETERNLTLSIYKLDEILKTNPNDMLTGIMRNNKQLELNQYKQSKEITLLKDKQVEQDKLLLEQKEKIDNMHLIGDRKQFTNEVKSISRQTGEKHDILYGLVYKELENKYGINLETRSKNRKQKIQDERLNSGKRPYSPSTLNGKAGKLVIADEEDLWRELGICLYNVRDNLLNK